MSRMIDDEETLKDDGLIEVDSCNVAECEFFRSKYIVDESIFCEFCTMFYNACLNNPDCYFKQLQRAKAEKQEKVLKMAEAEIEIEKLQAENEKLKERLENKEKAYNHLCNANARKKEQIKI